VFYQSPTLDRLSFLFILKEERSIEGGLVCCVIVLLFYNYRSMQTGRLTSTKKRKRGRGEDHDYLREHIGLVRRIASFMQDKERGKGEEDVSVSPARAPPWLVVVLLVCIFLLLALSFLERRPVDALASMLARVVPGATEKAVTSKEL